MSLFSNFFGGGANVGGLQRKQGALIERNNGLADLLMKSYYDQARLGAYDPNAQLDQMRRDHTYANTLQRGNDAASARIMGYRLGDSEPLLRQRAASERASLDYSRMANGIRAATNAAQSNALGGAVSGAANIYGNSIGAYGSQIAQANMQDQMAQAQFGGLLGAAMPYVGNLDFGKIFSKGTRKTPGFP